MSKDEFWINDISILYKDKKFIEFIPHNNMTLNQKLNAITRFCIYFICIVILFCKNDLWIVFAVLVIIGCIAYYNIRNNTKNNNEHFSFYSTSDNDDDTYCSGSSCLTNMLDNNNIIKNAYGNDAKYSDQSDNNSKSTFIETGYFDSRDKMKIGKMYNPPEYNRKKRVHFRNDVIYNDDNNKSCKKPTYQNPFMNPDITDFGNGEHPVACNADDNDIKYEIAEKFNKNLFRNVDDIFETENSKRQFYTIPNTGVPNNQTEFAEWLWKPKTTCKEDQENCLRYEDLRFKR